MENMMVAGVIAVFYALVRFIEMRFILKETQPLKTILRDTIIVYLSAIAGMFIVGQIQENAPISKIPEVMIGDGGF